VRISFAIDFDFDELEELHCPGARAPSPINQLLIERYFSMKTVKLSWALPTTRVQGESLVPAELSHTEILLSADGGANFSVLANVPAPIVDLIQPNLEPGSYVFRLVAVDKSTPPKRSAPVDFPYSFTEVSAPSPVTAVTVEDVA
jgi:hypothetical protein